MNEGANEALQRQLQALNEKFAERLSEELEALEQYAEQLQSVREQEQRRQLMLALLESRAGVRQARLDLGAVFGAGLGDLHHAIDEQPQPLFGRQAPRASVRAGEQAEFLQILHDVADRRGRQVERGELRQGARPDRLAGFEIGVDDQPEHVAGARGEFGDRRGGHWGDLGMRGRGGKRPVPLPFRERAARLANLFASRSG